MRVAYFDLGLSREEYGLQPTRYGGGAVAARHLKEDPDIVFDVYAPVEAFHNVGAAEARHRCFILPPALSDGLKRGLPLDTVEGLALDRYDLVLHPHTCGALNLGGWRKGPQVHFCGFDGAAGHPGNDYILLYDPSFTPRFGERAKYVRIGKPIPVECPARAADVEPPFVFQCSRHDSHMGSVELAKACRAAQIPVIFAGPIHPGCTLMEHIDGVLLRYVGEIGEAQKLDYCRRAALFSIMYDWDPPFSQSLVEAQGQGTPIYCPKRGPFLATYLQHGLNGFDANLMDLPTAFRSAATLDRAACWRAAREYDASVMVESFKTAFCEIVDEWRVNPVRRAG